MDSLNLTIDSAQVSSPINDTAAYIVNNINYFEEILRVIIVKGTDIGLFAVLVFLVFKFSRKFNSTKPISEELSDNAVSLINAFMLGSSVSAIILFALSSVERGEMLTPSFMRYTFIGFIELILYLGLTKYFIKDLRSLTLVKISISILFLTLAITCTRIMQLLYYEATGVVRFVYIHESFTPQIIGMEGSRISISAVILIWCTPFFSVLEALFKYLEDSSKAEIIKIKIEEEKIKEKKEEEKKITSIVPVEKKKKTQ